MATHVKYRTRLHIFLHAGQHPPHPSQTLLVLCGDNASTCALVEKLMPTAQIIIPIVRKRIANVISEQGTSFLYTLPACPSSRCWGLMMFSLAGYFLLPECDSCPAQRPQGKERGGCMGGPTLHPVGCPGHPSARGKKPLPLPNWRCFPVRWVPVSDANGEAAGEGTSPTGRRACISIQIEISVLFAKGGGGGEYLKGVQALSVVLLIYS